MRNYLKNTAVAVLAVSILVLAGACDKKISDPSPQAGIMPLAVGNWWEFIDTTYIDDDITTGSYKMGISGWREIELDGTKWTAFEYSSYFAGSEEVAGPIWFYTNDADFGLRCLGGEHFENDLIVNNLQVKFPIAEGETWETMLIVYSGGFQIIDTIMAECIGTGQVFSTPAGDFETTVYRYTYPRIEEVSGTMTAYYAPNVGLVGSIWVQSDGIRTVSHLNDFFLKRF